MESDAETRQAYPPEPWRLRGDLHTSVFLVPMADMPLVLPSGWRPLRLGRFGVVGTAWVTYRPGGVLSYDELMSTLLVRRGWRVQPTITHIWVDSPASRDGGRELWGLPKELASFRAFSAITEDGPLATGSVSRLVTLPWRLPGRFSVVQRLAGATKLTPVRFRGLVALSRTTFAADPAGPLAFLAGRRVLLSLSLIDFRMTFGGG
ncbi:MAG: acetoacetate decarboxylase family protein [Pseudonocardiales bacterium]|nr:acetoacetate decarboxylase family protein [Actinomycetota bacterium]